MHRTYLRASWSGLLFLLAAGMFFGPARAAERSPNIVLIYFDDLGWGDWGCFGSRSIRTPHIDRLAAEGTRFTSFYVSQPVCSASRASLLTGCYANRVGIHGALGPESKVGLSTNEVTLARLLKSQGYATAAVGKWHLGRPVEFLPLHHGFDEYLGLPYSNDMWPNHPTARPGYYPALPLIDGDAVVETMPDQRQLTTRYTARAVSFIERHRDQPFFLYLAHSMPHVPLHVSPARQGHSASGVYGDVIEELDDSVGQVLAALDRLQLRSNTWVVVTSDNGPWLSYGNHAGSAGPFREGKGTVFEGGVRVPCVMRWPGHIPAGRTCDEPLMTIDLLPTIAGKIGAPLPPLGVDGRECWPVLEGKGRNQDRTYLFYYGQNELQALRRGHWKLILPHTAAVLEGQGGGNDGIPVAYRRLKTGVELYDLDSDPGETRNLAGIHTAVRDRLLAEAEAARSDLGDALTGRKGTGNREPGKVTP